jgi:hypothetical protein
LDGELRKDVDNYWTADQYTFRMIRDGLLEQVKTEGRGQATTTEDKRKK